MKHNIVIAQVGKGRYPEALYQRREANASGEVIETCYSFEAVIRECFKGQEMDILHVILVGTNDSNWDDLFNYYPFGEIDADVPKKAICKKEFENSLADKLKKRIEIINECKTEHDEKLLIKDIQINQIIIEQGQSGEELRSNFNDLQNAVNTVRRSEGKEADWDVYFDISNGFRSFPIYIYTLINYLSQEESGKTRCHMFYGMFDSKITVDGKEVTPLVDLQFIDDLLLLINAVSEFQNCGSVKQILEILLIHPKWDIRIGKDDRETLSYAFKMFDYGTNANNLAAIEIGINLLEGIGDKIDSTNLLNDAEKLLIKEIAYDFSVRFGTEELRKKKHYPYSYLMIKLAEWFHETGREGNAAITVQETVLTYLMERYEDQIKEYLLDKQLIGDLDMDEFNAGCRLRDPKYLFEYKLRQPVRFLLQKLKEEENTDISEFYIRYRDIKKNVRDIMAHVVLSEQSAANYEAYQSTIICQIRYLLKEIEYAENAADGEEDKSDGDAIIERLFSGSEIESIIEKKKEKTLQKILREPIDDEGEDEFLHDCNRLAKQMEHLKEITDSNPENVYAVFLQESDQLDLILKCMDMWIRDDHGEEVNPELYYDRYFRTKITRKRKKGCERLMAYIEGHLKAVVSILENQENYL